MSHFTVTVVTDNGTNEEIEKALRPFHEFECTGVDDQYVQDVDITEEVIKEWKERNEKYEDEQVTLKEYLRDWYSYKLVNVNLEPDLEEDHKYGYALLDENEKVAKVIDRTNPDAKWDWYEVGGRWKGQLLTKGGIRVDSCKKSMIDVEGIIENGLEFSRKQYHQVHNIIGDDAFDDFVGWDQCLKDFNEDLIAARDFYHSQPAIQRKNESKDINIMMLNIEDFNMPLAEYLARVSKGALSTFAILYEGKWSERGKMGWWCCVAGEDDDFDDVFNKIWATIPDDKFITIVDCHI